MNTPPKTVKFPYHDSTLSTEQRVEDLLSRMSIEDKTGLMFQNVAPSGGIHDRHETFNVPSIASMIEKRRMNHFNMIGTPGDSPRAFAAWNNSMQQFASDVGLGIPVSMSSDPRHTFTDNPATAMMAGHFSQWPETLGLAAVGSEELVEEFADIVRQEYLAVGLRVALHPQIDLSTEPRWSRINGTFGEDADLTSRLVAAYLRGIQTREFGTNSVSAMVKHFPGGGPQKDGTDPHFVSGKDQVYPGGHFEYHLKPFISAIEAGARQMMPYYGRPIGTQYEEVGFGFNRAILTGILRERLGFDGIICTDWGLLTDLTIDGELLPARAWGVEHLSREEKLVLILEAGADQFGGEICSDVLSGLVKSGRISETRIDQSARRLLREKFELGLFDNPFVDEDRADAIVGNAGFQRAGRLAQSRSVTVLTNKQLNGNPVLPLKQGLKLYIEGADPAAIGHFGTVVDRPEDADLAIVRTLAPHVALGDGGFEQYFNGGSLEFTEEQLEHLSELQSKAPLLVDVYLDRPAVMAGVVELTSALTVNFGCTDAAFFDALYGVVMPEGKLPFDLPRSDVAIIASRTDVPFDTENPFFRFGEGLSIS